MLVGHALDGFMVHDPNNLPATIQPDLAAAWDNPNGDNPANAMLILREGAPVPPPTPISKAWRGLQLRNGDNTTDDWACISIAKLDAVKFTTDTSLDDLRYACTLVPPEHILVRLFMPGDDPNLADPLKFASLFGGWLTEFARLGGKYVEVHNEPNLDAEGCGIAWNNGTDFSNWLISALVELRRRFPMLRYGFPALSPGHSISGVRFDEETFYAFAHPAIMQCDWIGVHCYWLNGIGMYASADGAHYQVYKDEGLPLIVTEFSNPNPDLVNMPKEKKARQYKAWYANLPSYVIGAYSFISSSDNPAFASETWAGTEIPEIVGGAA